MAWHTRPVGAAPATVDEFEVETLQRYQVEVHEVPPRYRTTYFAHIWDGGYQASYYAYLWADTLTADAAEAFVEAGSFYDKKTAKRLYDSIMSVGNSIPPEDAFRKFRGRDVDSNALMRDRGFPIS